MSSYEFPVRLPQELLTELAEFTGNPDSYSWVLEPFVCEAIRNYMRPASANEQLQSGQSGQSGQCGPFGTEDPTEAGYQWKELFLPHGTRLRASFQRQPYFATVEGAEIRHGESALTPSGFANLRGSGNRNAWKAIWLRLPGSDAWLLADVCRSARRRAIERLLSGGKQAGRQQSPAASPPQQSAASPQPQQSAASPQPQESLAASRPQQSLASPRPQRSPAAPRPQQSPAAPRPQQEAAQRRTNGAASRPPVTKMKVDGKHNEGRKTSARGRRRRRRAAKHDGQSRQ